MVEGNYTLEEFVWHLRNGISNGISNGILNGVVNQFNNLVEAYSEYSESHPRNGRKSIAMDIPINSSQDVMDLSELERLGFIHLDVITPANMKTSRVTLTETGKYYLREYEKRVLSRLVDQLLERLSHDPAEI